MKENSIWVISKFVFLIYACINIFSAAQCGLNNLLMQIKVRLFLQFRGFYHFIIIIINEIIASKSCFKSVFYAKDNPV